MAERVGMLLGMPVYVSDRITDGFIVFGDLRAYIRVRCPVCGEVVTPTPGGYCPKCGDVVVRPEDDE